MRARRLRRLAGVGLALALPPLPGGWSHHLPVGLTDPPGGAARLHRSAPFAQRYQYLAGGVNTGQGWATWNPRGTFATRYIRESRRAGLTPVLTYYQLLQSAPAGGAEAGTDLAHLRSPALMRAYYRDFALLLRRAGALRRARVVVHVEPDLWGYVEQAARRDDARTVPAAVAATGLPALRGLPDDASGFARALVRLRDRRAPNVRLAYHVSVWGTGTDIQLQDPPMRTVARLAARSARFERSLHARFDLLFGEFSDRDLAFKRVVYGDGGASRWTRGDFARHLRYVRGVVRRTHRRMVLWQIPVGNTLMRAQDDTWGHFQDNHAQWLLGARGGRRHLRAYARAGVIGLLFGGGAEGTTCACDARHDGVTNPPPIGANRRRSRSADDDGGYLRARVRALRRAGGLALPRR